MRVCVVGLGGVGGYVAAMFAKNNIDVVGVAKGKHYKAIQQNGIEIIENGESFSLPLNVKEPKMLNGVFDVVLFCVKSYDLAAAATMLQPHCDSKTVTLSFSNGVNNDQILKKILKKSIVANGCIYILAEIQTYGTIKKHGKVFSAVFGGDGSDVLVKLFEKSNLRFKNSLDIQKDIWKKYIFIAAFANLTCYYNESIYNVANNHHDVAKTILEEIAQLAKLEGVLIEKEVGKSLDVAKNLPKDATTSMHKDMQEGKKIEIESLGSFLLECAKKHTVSVATLERIVAKNLAYKKVLL